MQTHQLKPKHKFKDKKRIGRGGKKGTYSGRGGKGQTARAGRKLAPIIREVIKRYHKLKGYRAFRVYRNLSVVNSDVLEKKIYSEELINPKTLVEKGIIHKIKGKVPQVKILGGGKLNKKLVVENCQVSKTAKEAIEKAGGIIR